MADDLSGDLRDAWHQYVDLLIPFRTALYGYCRQLTGSVWDAEDLVQETLLRGFGRWGITAPGIRDPRAYLLRTATNVWIDDLRRRGREVLDGGEADERPAPDQDPSRSSEVRDAGARLLQRLSPQERAAVLLKETFDMTLEEIAELLATSVGTIKSALHRGRQRLRQTEDDVTERRQMPSPELLDRFIECYDARDVNALLALMLDGATAENVGNSVHVGRETPDGVQQFLRSMVHGHADWAEEFQLKRAGMRRSSIEGEPVILAFVFTRSGRQALSSVFRFEERDGGIARILSYAFCPDTIRAIAESLGMPAVTGLYRAPTPVRSL